MNVITTYLQPCFEDCGIVLWLPDRLLILHVGEERTYHQFSVLVTNFRLRPDLTPSHLLK